MRQPRDGLHSLKKDKMTEASGMKRPYHDIEAIIIPVNSSFPAFRKTLVRRSILPEEVHPAGGWIPVCCERTSAFPGGFRRISRTLRNRLPPRPEFRLRLRNPCIGIQK